MSLSLSLSIPWPEDMRGLLAGEISLPQLFALTPTEQTYFHKEKVWFALRRERTFFSSFPRADKISYRGKILFREVKRARRSNRPHPINFHQLVLRRTEFDLCHVIYQDYLLDVESTYYLCGCRCASSCLTSGGTSCRSTGTGRAGCPSGSAGGSTGWSCA